MHLKIQAFMTLHRLSSILSILAASVITVLSTTSCASDKGKKIENDDREESVETRAAAPGLAIHEVWAEYDIDGSLIDRIAATGATVPTTERSYFTVPSEKVEEVNRIIREFPMPEKMIPAWSYSKNTSTCQDQECYDLYLLHRTPAITYSDVACLYLDDDLDGNKAVSGQLTDEGAEAFAFITKDNIGKPLAIVVDGKVISAPNISQPITGGKFQITGYFDDVKKVFDMVTAPESDK